MASTFAFVPRKVSRTAKTQAQASGIYIGGIGATPPALVQGSTRLPISDTPKLNPASRPKQDIDNHKGKAKAIDGPSKSLSDEDYAILVCMALSDYSLWSDPDLRRSIEQHPERCKCLVLCIE